MSNPSQRNAANEIGNIVRGVARDVAVERVIEHIQKTQGFLIKAEIFRYWSKLKYDQKVDLVKDALE